MRFLSSPIFKENPFKRENKIYAVSNIPKCDRLLNISCPFMENDGRVKGFI